ncbi:hypothetical protein IVB12_15715 [Bradyrhizobium sp. 179]|uniref:hypothetical protein n=1 Tax=Bradyrhizobium sp. 179 TaxID=2782648 RepID=UPI001FF8BCF4|nr:hypothetical protein [Bradyrhizobium sp. 179]MCK1543363.1 hypothetical protein [Bradyrhizobium sp. 179]
MSKAAKRTRRVWTKDDLRALKRHSKEGTKVARVSKELKRSVGALRAKAHELGVGLGPMQR